MPKQKLKRCSKGDHYTYKSRFGKKSKSTDGLEYSCKPCLNLYKSGWRKDNPDRVKEENRKSNLSKKESGYLLAYGRSEKKKTYDREWAKNNKAKRKAINQKSKSRPEAKEKTREQNRLRRALLRGLPNTMPYNWWNLMLAYYGNACAVCGTDKDLQHDHIIPITKPGSTHSLLNSQILCKTHNSSKGNRHTIDYRDWSKGILLDSLEVVYSLESVS